MDRRAQLLHDKMNRRMRAIKHLQAQVQQLKKDQDRLLQKIKKANSEQNHDLQSLHLSFSERRKLVSELKNLGQKKR